MRELRRICSKLSRTTGDQWVVVYTWVSNSKRQYQVRRLWRGTYALEGLFRTIPETKRFLLDQFLEDK